MANEKRLIDANALIKAIDDYMLSVYSCSLNEVAEFQSNPYNSIKTTYIVEGLHEATEIIDEAPTVDAVEVVHGRWEKCWQEISKHYFRCSNCHTAYMDGVSGAIAPEYGSRAWRYCPSCGAKMDGDVNV